MRSRRRLYVPIVILLLGGCTVDMHGRDGRSRWFVGIVRVTLPDTQGALAAVRTSTLGAGWDTGPFLGFHGGDWVVADPAACQLVVIIRSPTQAAHAAKILKSIEGQQPCIVDHTHASRH